MPCLLDQVEPELMLLVLQATYLPQMELLGYLRLLVLAVIT
jgi:hypothetical protein